MDRLLSDQEFQVVFCEGCPEHECQHICGAGSDAMKVAAAQLAKADKEWLEWVVIEAEVIRLGDEQDILSNGDYIAIPVERWKAHRKEIGL